jgi:hypothetical protein
MPFFCLSANAIGAVVQRRMGDCLFFLVFCHDVEKNVLILQCKARMMPAENISKE